MHCIVGLCGNVPALEKGKMTELSRYLVRKGSAGWMVWDRYARAPARLEEGRPATYFERFPKDRYQTEVESWRELQSNNAEFTMKRLREPIEGGG